VPEFDTHGVVGDGRVADGIVCLHNAIGVILNVALTDLSSELDQVLFDLAFIHKEEDVHGIQRLDGLHGDVLRVSGADANQIDFSHSNSISEEGGFCSDSPAKSCSSCCSTSS
jgi:hypothetical protein